MIDFIISSGVILAKITAVGVMLVSCIAICLIEIQNLKAEA